MGASATKKYGGKNVLMISVLLWSLSTFLVPLFAHSIYALLISRVVLGLGEGLGKYMYPLQGSKCPYIPGFTHGFYPGKPGLGFKPYFEKVGT